MADAGTRPSVYHFGNFELDTRSGELRKNGTRIRLQDQPLQILLLLLDRPGELVSREEIQKKLWPDGTFVDYDNAINTAVRKLREALGDDSGERRFIETFSRRGYRFIGNIEEPARPPQPEAPPPATTPVPLQSRKGLVAACSGAALALAAAFLWLWPRSPEETKSFQLKPVPLTAAQGIEGDASFSPDGNEVAYSWDEGKNDVSHIYVKLIGSATALRLTAGGAQDVSPVWSPDGRSIAFLRQQGSDVTGTSQLCIIPALGGAARLVATGYIGEFQWSPDSRFLAVTFSPSADDPSSLYLVRLENGEKLKLTTPPNARTSDFGPAFAPDGHVLAFVRASDIGWTSGLFLLDLSKDHRPAGEPQLLSKETIGAVRKPVWTSDGKEIVYSLYEDYGIRRVMRIRAQIGARPRPLTPAGENADAPAVSQQGNRLAYTKVLSDSDILQIRPGNAPRNFASSTRNEDSPQYSADGEHVAFVSYRSGHSQIWTCDKDGGNPAQLTRDEFEPAGSPHWAPDGRWISFGAIPKGKGGERVFVMASDGSLRHRLTSEDDADESIPSWSRDGKWIYYVCDRANSQGEIWKVSAQGGKGVQVTHGGGWVALESCDQRTLYYVKGDDSGLWALPLEGGEEKRVLESVFMRAFAVVEDGIYYIPKPAERGRASVRFHRFATNEDREIAGINQEPYLGMTVSPDRKSILVTAWNPTRSENIMIVDNFR